MPSHLYRAAFSLLITICLTLVTLCVGQGVQTIDVYGGQTFGVALDSLGFIYVAQGGAYTDPLVIKLSANGSRVQNFTNPQQANNNV